jgi:ABC-2 type transport system ATP-binding protein
MTPTIEAHGLQKRYRKTHARRARASRRARAGGGRARPGAGKTTFVRALATLLRLDAGTLQVCGYAFRAEPQLVRRLIGLAGRFAAVEPAMTRPREPGAGG